MSRESGLTLLELLFTVAMFGVTGRARVLRYDAASRKWTVL
jgi:hypothetical protein